MMLLAIARGPQCPKCGNDGFDDWHLDKSCRSGGGLVVDIYADLTCECGATFEVAHYADGETHSSISSPHPSQELR